jgi:NADH:ubiquinone oxidoreductase subunit K
MDAQGQKINTSTVAKSVEAATLSTAFPAASQAEPSGVSRVSTERRSPSPRPHATVRRRNKLFQFLLCEVVAISILLPLVMLGISGRFTDQTLILLIRILIVSAVAAVVIFPMIFFRRWENSRARER